MVGPLQVWFTGLAASAEQRAAVVRQTLDGALSSVWPRAAELADASEAQVKAGSELRQVARTAYAAAIERVSTGISDGALLRGEVLARWQEFVGTGDLLRAMESRVGRLRDRISAAFSGRVPRASQLQVALESGLAQLITSAAEQAAEQAATSWRARPAGAALLKGAEEDLGRSSAALHGEVERLVREWQGSVLEMVRTEGASRRTVARLSAYGVNASGLVVMVAVFASTHFIPTGLEIAVAGGTTALSQKLLEAVFGDQAVRRLASKARTDLIQRVETVLAAEEVRYSTVLDAVAADPEVPTGLRASAMVAEAARKRLADATVKGLAAAKIKSKIAISDDEPKVTVPQVSLPDSIAPDTTVEPPTDAGTAPADAPDIEQPTEDNADEPAAEGPTTPAEPPAAKVAPLVQTATAASKPAAPAQDTEALPVKAADAAPAAAPHNADAAPAEDSTPADAPADPAQEGDAPAAPAEEPKPVTPAKAATAAKPPAATKPAAKSAAGRPKSPAKSAPSKNAQAKNTQVKSGPVKTAPARPKDPPASNPPPADPPAATTSDTTKAAGTEPRPARSAPNQTDAEAEPAGAAEEANR